MNPQPATLQELLAAAQWELEASLKLHRERPRRDIFSPPPGVSLETVRLRIPAVFQLAPGPGLPEPPPASSASLSGGASLLRRLFRSLRWLLSGAKALPSPATPPRSPIRLWLELPGLAEVSGRQGEEAGYMEIVFASRSPGQSLSLEGVSIKLEKSAAAYAVPLSRGPVSATPTAAP